MRLYLVPLLLLPVAPLVAQVGFLPTSSPYHEILHGTYFEGEYGRIYGNGGLFSIGPRDGNTESLLFTIRARNTLQFSFGGWTANAERNVVDANDSVATRVSGPFKQRLIAGEIGIQLNLTGGKTWHGAAPFVGVGFGLVNGQFTPATDTSGYSFGTKLYFAPYIGTRFFLTQRAYLRVDLRADVWKLNYPASYLSEPTEQPGTLAHPNAVNPTGITGEYTISPSIRFGLGIAW